MDDPAAAPADDWTPPVYDTETGVAQRGAYPLNSRLRAEAIAQAGESEDPDGIVTPELIADAAIRLDREAAEQADKTPSMSWTRDRLVAHAATVPGATFEGDANKAAILAAIEGATRADQVEA